jgi:hypothetical protein
MQLTFIPIPIFINYDFNLTTRGGRCSKLRPTQIIIVILRESILYRAIA